MRPSYSSPAANRTSGPAHSFVPQDSERPIGSIVGCSRFAVGPLDGEPLHGVIAVEDSKPAIVLAFWRDETELEDVTAGEACGDDPTASERVGLPEHPRPAAWCMGVWPDRAQPGARTAGQRGIDEYAGWDTQPVTTEP